MATEGGVNRKSDYRAAAAAIRLLQYMQILVQPFSLGNSEKIARRLDHSTKTVSFLIYNRNQLHKCILTASRVYSTEASTL